MALVAFVVFVLIGQVLNVFLSLAIDRIYSPAVGVMTFVFLYGLVFVVAYKLALLLFDREQEPARGRQASDRKAEAPRRQQAAFRAA